MHQPEEATQKAKELLQMIVAKSAKLCPLSRVGSRGQEARAGPRRGPLRE